MGVVLDNINWYDNDIQNPVFYSKSGNIDYYDHRFKYYFSNSIRFFKEFDYGNRFNLVEIMIDRTEDNKILKTYPDKFKNILLQLGKPLSQELKCIFSDDDQKMLKDCSSKMGEFIRKENELNIPDFSVLKVPKEDYLIDSITPIKGFSPKAILNKSAKKYGY